MAQAIIVNLSKESDKFNCKMNATPELKVQHMELLNQLENDPPIDLCAT